MFERRLFCALACVFALTLSLGATPNAVSAGPFCLLQRKPPRLVHAAPLVYPEISDQQGAGGEVAVTVHLDEAGNTLSATILSTSGFADLDHAAIDAAMRSTYRPEESNCRFVPSNVVFHAQFYSAPPPTPAAVPVIPASLAPSPPPATPSPAAFSSPLNTATPAPIPSPAVPSPDAAPTPAASAPAPSPSPAKSS